MNNTKWTYKNINGLDRRVTETEANTYIIEGSSQSIRNGLMEGESYDKIDYVYFDGGPCVAVGRSLSEYGAIGDIANKTIKSVKMSPVPASELETPDWARVQITV